jgi:hypothetical protein
MLSIYGQLGTANYGPCGGGLGFPGVTWNLSNIGGQTINWSVSWSGGVLVTVNPPTQGGLAPGQSTSVNAAFSINASAMSFTMAFYQNGTQVASSTFVCT